MLTGPGPLWQPTPERIEGTQLTAFTRAARDLTGRTLDDYAALHRWSVTDPEHFWRLVWTFTDVIGDPGASTVADPERFPGARWFPDARLNFAENLLRHEPDRIALVSVLETDDPQFEGRTLTYGDLAGQSAALARHLAGIGVGPGDRVAAWLPNVPETIVTLLAASRLGAVFTSCSPDFGVNGALDRFGQVSPRALIVCDGYSYNGREQIISGQVTELAQRLPDPPHLIWVDRIGRTPEDAIRFDAVVAEDDGPVPYHACRFSDPLCILFSSGTTGVPKCIVHSVGGTLLQHLKEHRLHVDLRRNDRFFYFTTCGWMMWNWLVTGLATGSRLILYEGAPTWPEPDRLFTMAARLGISVFGTSARYLSSLAKLGVRPAVSHELGTLRTLLSTGSPLLHEGFSYVYEGIKADVHLASISGGTDIVSCFVLGNPNAPVYPGEMQVPGLGMAVDVFDADGKPVRGEKGELVCTRSFPSCPIGFWNDPDGVKFQAAYFERFPGVWTHGDFAEVTRHDGFIIHGRSDAVLNPGGVRIGTAEIYRQVETIEEVQEAICVGQTWNEDVRVILFVVMQPGESLTEDVEHRIRESIRRNASPRHVPAKILTVPEIPRTVSGKIVELAVRDVIHGRTVENTTALANPEALEHFANRQELLD